MSFFNMASRLYNQSTNVDLNNDNSSSNYFQTNEPWSLRSISRSATSANTALQSQNLVSIPISNSNVREQIRRQQNRCRSYHNRVRASLQSSSTALTRIFDDSGGSSSVAGMQIAGRFSRLESYPNDMLRRLANNASNMRSNNNDLLLPDR